MQTMIVDEGALVSGGFDVVAEASGTAAGVATALVGQRVIKVFQGQDAGYFQDGTDIITWTVGAIVGNVHFKGCRGNYRGNFRIH